MPKIAVPISMPSEVVVSLPARLSVVVPTPPFVGRVVLFRLLLRTTVPPAGRPSGS